MKRLEEMHRKSFSVPNVSIILLLILTIIAMIIIIVSMIRIVVTIPLFVQPNIQQFKTNKPLLHCGNIFYAGKRSIMSKT